MSTYEECRTCTHYYIYIWRVSQLYPLLHTLSICLFLSISIHVITLVYRSICFHLYMKSVFTSNPWCDVVCCSVLQCVAVCCSVCMLSLSLSIYLLYHMYLNIHIFPIYIWKVSLLLTPGARSHFLSLSIYDTICIYTSICFHLHIKSIWLLPPGTCSQILPLSIYLNIFICLHIYMSLSRHQESLTSTSFT